MKLSALLGRKARIRRLEEESRLLELRIKNAKLKQELKQVEKE